MHPPTFYRVQGIRQDGSLETISTGTSLNRAETVVKLLQDSPSFKELRIISECPNGHAIGRPLIDVSMQGHATNEPGVE